MIENMISLHVTRLGNMDQSPQYDDDQINPEIKIDGKIPNLYFILELKI